MYNLLHHCTSPPVSSPLPLLFLLQDLHQNVSPFTRPETISQLHVVRFSRISPINSVFIEINSGVEPQIRVTNFQPKTLEETRSISPMEVEGSSKPMIATQQQLMEAKVPLAYRDQCAHLLILLNKFRQSELYLPWKYENERHSYEKCQ